jgi:hypothetical protein
MLQNKGVLELAWWVFTLLMVVLFIYPIQTNFPDFQYKIANILFIVAAVTFGRLIFFLNYSYIAKNQYIKAGYILLATPMIFYFVQRLNNFHTLFDENDFGKIFKNVPETKHDWLFKYLKIEYRLWAVAAIVLSVALMIRFLFSIWQKINENKK